MGNHHVLPRGTTPTSTDLTDGATTNHPKTVQYSALDQLFTILTDASSIRQDDSCQCHIADDDSIGLDVFTRHLLPNYPILAEKFYQYLEPPQVSQLKANSEKYLGILDDGVAVETLVRMFTAGNVTQQMSTDDLTLLLQQTYTICMDHYLDGPRVCPATNDTLAAIVKGCFHGKTSLSPVYVSRWLLTNCPRLLLPLHRYLTHVLSTAYRQEPNEGPILVAGLELSTPVLEQVAPPQWPNPILQPIGATTTLGGGGGALSINQHQLQMSLSWLLAGVLPPLYSRPVVSPTTSKPSIMIDSCQQQQQQHSATLTFLSKLICTVPSHWCLLYDSNEMGLGTNRFLHHVLHYRGPTLCLFGVEGGRRLFCVAAPSEWRDTHLYWGGDEAAVLQLAPEFQVLERGVVGKSLYLNTGVRGYPYGLRAGHDPRAPILTVDGAFERLEYCRIPYRLEVVEVWGCGDVISREKQLDMKKWEVHEALERRRCTTNKLSAADWLEHPDRYLLEMAGRSQYTH